MRNIRICLESHTSDDLKTQINTPIPLSKEKAHYLTKVLRLSDQMQLAVFTTDNSPIEFQALFNAHDKTILIQSSITALTESRLPIHLGLGVLKKDKMDLAIQKATELGITEITPLLTEYVDIKIPKLKYTHKQQHWQKIAYASAEQSRRVCPPHINDIVTLQNWQPKNPNLILLHPYPVANTPNAKLADLHFDSTIGLTLTIGPEGGFSDNDILTCNTLDKTIMTTLSLGKRILRAETTVISTLTLLQHYFGDLSNS